MNKYIVKCIAFSRLRNEAYINWLGKDGCEHSLGAYIGEDRRFEMCDTYIEASYVAEDWYIKRLEEIAGAKTVKELPKYRYGYAICKYDGEKLFEHRGWVYYTMEENYEELNIEEILQLEKGQYHENDK